MKKTGVKIVMAAAFVGMLGIASMANARSWSKVVDYGMSGYSETSSNWASRGGGYNGSYRFLSREVGNGTKIGTATWKVTVPYCGYYKITASCYKTENRATDVDYYITKNTEGEETHIEMSQFSASSVLDWDTLGTFKYKKNQTVRVYLDGDDGASACADAVSWTLVKESTCASPGTNLIAPILLERASKK